MELTERLISYHLGKLMREFESGNLNENFVENMDETHFLYDLDDHYSITRRGSKSVDYTAVVSGGTGMTLALRLSGGPNSKLEAPFFIFKNENANYPIAESPDNVPGVSYRTQRSGWMDRSTFPKYLREPRAISALPVVMNEFYLLTTHRGMMKRLTSSLPCQRLELPCVSSRQTLHIFVSPLIPLS